MAPATLELLLLGLMHFALARLDIWHWKVLQMLLQNSGILTEAAFLPSTTPDECSWDGQPLQLGELAGSFQVTETCFPLAFPQPGCFFTCSFPSGCTVTPPWRTRLSRGVCEGSSPCLGAEGSQRQDP